MPILKVQHSFQGQSGVAADQYVNTFHLLCGVVSEADLEDIATVIREFYSVGQGGGTHPIAYYMAPGADTIGERVKIYDLSDSIPREPIYDVITTPEAMGGPGVALPSEVAVCLSYSGVPASGIPLASTRGRIYIGPLSTSAMGSELSDHVSRPHIAFLSALVFAGQRVANQLADATPITTWVVHSVTHAHDSGIVRFWADDAWDTQRRRGDPPTSRQTSTV